jgi:hypothetical protein
MSATTLQYFQVLSPYEAGFLKARDFQVDSILTQRLHSMQMHLLISRFFQNGEAPASASK